MCVFVGMPPFSNPRSLKLQCVARETMQFYITTMDLFFGQYLFAFKCPIKQFDNDKKLSYEFIVDLVTPYGTI